LQNCARRFKIQIQIFKITGANMTSPEERETTSAPTTPGQAEGSENIEDQSHSTPSPTTPGTAEGGAEDDNTAESKS